MLAPLLALALLLAPGRPIVVTLQTSGTVPLAWDANDPSENVTDYIVEYGGTAAPFSVRADVGNVTQWTSPTLTADTYTFRVYAVDADGLTSNPSNAVSTPVPVPTQDPSCMPPLGANAVTVAVTKIRSTTPPYTDANGLPIGNVGSQFAIDYQANSLGGSAIVSVDTLINGTKTDPTQTGTLITRMGSIWFTSPTTAGTYNPTLVVTNGAGCTTTATLDPTGKALSITVK